MNIAETIRQAREARGLTQEDLAERCQVSRQAVSKWEVGVSVPTPENLKILEEALGVSLETEEGAAPSPAPKRNPWKTTALALIGLLGGLILAALVSVGIYVSASPRGSEVSAVSQEDPAEPAITGIWFFDEDGAPLEPDKGDLWNAFAVGRRVYLLMTFRQGAETGVQGVSLFATPTGTETYDEREQIALQAVYDRTAALFALDFPEEAMFHLDVVLECDLDQRVTQTLNVIAVPEEDLLPAP